MSNQTIKCPDCGKQIDISEVIVHQLEAEFKQKHLQEQKALRDEVEAKRAQYKTHLEELKAKEEALDTKVAEATRVQLKAEREKLYDDLKRQIVEEQGESVALLQKEIEEKSKQVQQLNTFKVEIEKLKREKEESQAKAQVEAQIELNKQLSLEKEKIKKLIESENELKLKAKEEQIEQMKRDIENAKRKAEQSSMQVQGEAQEIAMEQWLIAQFPFDSIDEVKKGAYGADCIQTVHTREVQNCGVICYESKNTKTWSDGWIAKLKADMLQTKADIGVLVTAVFPNNMERMGFVDGVWVCSLEEFKGSVSLLRESLIRTHLSIAQEENKGDKMSLLYNYLTSNEFSMQMQAIVSGFTNMQTELEKEKRSTMASWSRRQKLIDGVLANTTSMYGSLQGIGGKQLVHIEQLELDSPNDESNLLNQ